MYIEIKENRIIIEFSEEETHFIEQKVGSSESENISNYMKVKLIKALSLEALDTESVPKVGKDFNLSKIKKVSAELKKTTEKTDKTSLVNNEPLKEKTSAGINLPVNAIPPIKEESSNKDESKTDGEIAAEVGDELLAELLDKDLFKGRQKNKLADKPE